MNRSNLVIKFLFYSYSNDQGGLGIQSIEIQKQAFQVNDFLKLIIKDGIWQTILENKYLKNHTIGKVVRKPRDSHFWFGRKWKRDS
jgi:hypothetical protein